MELNYIKEFLGFVSKLEKRLVNPLPGEKAHLRMASDVRHEELKINYKKSNAIPSSVLILLYPDNNSVNTILTLRQEYDGVHSGQVSFPGGRKEEIDNSLIDTALRETEEEIGLDQEQVTIIGSLTDLYIPPSNYLVKPFIGYINEKPELIPDTTEVAKIINVDLFILLESHIKAEVINVRGHKIKAPYFDIQGHVVWGATAMILSELLEIV